MSRAELVLLGIIVALVAGLLYARNVVLRERLAVHNAEAAKDSSRIVYRDSLHTVSERLAYQQTSNVILSGDQKRLLQVAHAQTQLIANLRVSLDSLSDVISKGTVTAGADTTLRLLAAQLDTAGFHVRLNATVPPPPSEATLHWSIRRDPIEIAAALNRDADGREALRAYAGKSETVKVDSVLVSVSNGLATTRRLAIPLLAILGGYVLGRLMK